MSYHSDLNITQREEGLAVARRQIVRDVMSKGHTQAEAERYAETRISKAAVQNDEYERRCFDRGWGRY